MEQKKQRQREKQEVEETKSIVHVPKIIYSRGTDEGALARQFISNAGGKHYDCSHKKMYGNLVSPDFTTQGTGRDHIERANSNQPSIVYGTPKCSFYNPLTQTQAGMNKTISFYQPPQRPART
jgi:hypothetical protein